MLLTKRTTPAAIRSAARVRSRFGSQWMTRRRNAGNDWIVHSAASSPARMTTGS